MASDRIPRVPHSIPISCFDLAAYTGEGTYLQHTFTGVDNSTVSRHTPSSGWSKSLLESLDTIWARIISDGTKVSMSFRTNQPALPFRISSSSNKCFLVCVPCPPAQRGARRTLATIRTSLFSKVTSLDERACSLELTGFTIVCVDTAPIPISGSLAIRMEVASWEADRFDHRRIPRTSVSVLCDPSN